MNIELDHLVVVARDLAQGARWAETVLGAAPAPGGRHTLMGTHNLVLALGGWPQAYLEIIAIDPDAPPPGRARWFGMDSAGDAAQASPRLVHWVARTTNLDMHRWGLVAAGFDIGPTLSFERASPRGPLRWRLPVRDDGRLLAGGALPTLIEWQDGHPTRGMPASGVVLEALAVRGLPPRAAEILRPLRVGLAAGPGPMLEARLVTPRGAVTLGTAA